jgi:hypothetical protein
MHGSEEESYVASCLGIASAPGVDLGIDDINGCADQLSASPCLGGGVFPSCVGYAGDLLYPNHDRRGRLAPGEACFAMVQCESGYCGSHGEGCGVCQRARALGETCVEADVCVQGQCLQGACQLPGAKLGERCIDYGGGDCQATLFCHTDGQSIEGTCAPRAHAGERCGDSPCEGELICDAGTCQAPAARAEATGLQAGAGCGTEIGGQCRADLSCDESHVCRPYRVLPAGAACGGVASTACAPEHECRRACLHGDCGDEGVCVPLPVVGDHCTPLGTCAYGATCVGFEGGDETKGLCVKRGAQGEPCPCSAVCR